MKELKKKNIEINTIVGFVDLESKQKGYIVYAGHGEFTAIKNEKTNSVPNIAYSVFPLKRSVQEVVAYLESRLGENNFIFYEFKSLKKLHKWLATDFLNI